MKTFAITTALIAAVAAPAFAQSQLERDLGVPAGTYSATQLSALANAAEQDGEGRSMFFNDSHGTKSVSTKGSKKYVYHGGDGSNS